ncbi:hypothetical protein V493_08191 [Pseudogymnoascus sp. VKM F-4281 (FW-2241)]|nr:hypothetical protein V493_08191 [Pseudogymnoascus sp. VKM F-4281 (FW-2241)]
MSTRTIPTRQKVDTDTAQVFQEKADVPTTGQTRLSQGQLESNNTTIATPEIDDENHTPEKKRSGGFPPSPDVEESEIESSPRYSDDIPILQRSDEVTPDRHVKVSGFTFDELVDRLLSQPMSKADANFTDIFLCMYRKFASPGMLLSAILSRLEKSADEKGQHFLTRTTVQLRIIAVLTKWISQYPGDFAAPQTNQKFSAFVEQISTEPAFNYAVQEMRNMLRFHVVENDDTRWEKSDIEIDSDLEDTNELVPVTSTQSSRSIDAGKNTSHTSLADEKNAKRDRRHSETVSVSSSEAVTAASQPSAFHTVRDYEIEAATFVPSRKHLLTKLLYHNCMEISDDDFADEITRIDWIMFSSVGVRDLVRDVSLSAKQKAKCKSLINVTRAINHFNHVAWWVTNLILLRDKAKHRAQILEKFMRIAWKLRQMNNYNGLAAVMAGIQNTGVGRLAQTQALISEECRKQFMRLEILMGRQRSHFAYRLAWQNSTLPRIPYVPLSRRDLASADEGSKTFVGPKGDRINWSKFEVFGGVILPIMKSHSTPVNLEKHDNAREIILDCFISADEDEIYQRSLSLEGSSSVPDPSRRNRFLWSRSFNQSVNY